MKKTVLFLLNVFVILIIALYFIPWYQYNYSLMGVNENGEEICSHFTEWWSPFYQLVLMNFNIGAFLFFMLSISFPIAALTYGTLSFLNKRYEKFFYLFIALTIIVFLITILIMFIFTPTR